MAPLPAFILLYLKHHLRLFVRSTISLPRFCLYYRITSLMQPSLPLLSPPLYSLFCFTLHPLSCSTVFAPLVQLPRHCLYCFIVATLLTIFPAYQVCFPECFGNIHFWLQERPMKVCLVVLWFGLSKYNIGLFFWLDVLVYHITIWCNHKLTLVDHSVFAVLCPFCCYNPFTATNSPLIIPTAITAPLLLVRPLITALLLPLLLHYHPYYNITKLLIATWNP